MTQTATGPSERPDPIDLTCLPTPTLRRKARTILSQIRTGVHYGRLRGKRLRWARGIVSVPVGRRYRLLFRVEQGRLRPIRCLSHEAYNKWRPGR